MFLVSLSPVPSIPGEHPANAPFHIPVSHPCHPHCHLMPGFGVALSVFSRPPLSFCRPRLEVLNASQNRIQHIAGLSLLPSLVVLNLGECPCPHQSAIGSDESVMRSLQRRPSPTVPRDLFLVDSAAIPPQIVPFSHASPGPIPPPFLLIFVLAVRYRQQLC